MSSLRVSTDVEPSSQRETVLRLLDSAFGFFVWAAHLLIVYIATAVACQLGVGTASAETRATFMAALIAITVVATAVIAMHAVRRYRAQRGIVDGRFRLTITVGCDAIASVATAAQLLPLLLVPLCA